MKEKLAFILELRRNKLKRKKRRKWNRAEFFNKRGNTFDPMNNPSFLSIKGGMLTKLINSFSRRIKQERNKKQGQKMKIAEPIFGMVILIQLLSNK